MEKDASYDKDAVYYKDEEKYKIAGLNCEKHRLALGDAQNALLNLGVRYIGSGNWKLPPGARIDYVGYDEDDRSDDWKITVEDQTYYVWSVG